MKNGRDFQSLVSEVERQANAKRDFVVRAAAVTMAGGRLVMPGDVGTLNAQDFAHRQLGEYVDVPSTYYDRLRGTFPGLLDTTVNTLLAAKPAAEKRLIRTLDNNARAWLSDRYRPIDNVDLMGKLLPVLMGRKDLSFRSAEITPTRLYIKIISSELEGEVKRGDVVRMGLLLQNSEVGAGSVTIAPFSERLVCTNGATHVDLGTRRAHLGKALGNGDDGDLLNLLSDETRKADDTAYFLKVRDIVANVLSGKTLELLLNKMREATADALPQGNPADIVEAATMKLGLNETERGATLRHLIEGADLSRWGLANAVTRAAQDASDYDRATELEKIGGRLMVEAPPATIYANTSQRVTVRRAKSRVVEPVGAGDGGGTMFA